MRQSRITLSTIAIGGTRIKLLDTLLIVVMLGAVLHDLGKPPTTAVVDGRIRSLDRLLEAGRQSAGAAS